MDDTTYLLSCIRHEWEESKKENQKLKEELQEMSDYADKLAEGLPCLPADVENLRETNLILATESEELKSLFTNFLDILNIQEMSDSGRVFKPNKISSCRVMDMEKMGKILARIEEIIRYQRPPKIKDL